MKKATLLLAALLLATGLAAQNPTLYFMEGSTYRSQLNPAFAPQRGYVNLPGIGGMEVGINGNVALDNILYPRNGRLVTLLDSSVPADVALSGLSAQNRIGAETRINLFGIGMFTANHKNFWSFDLALRTSEETTLPRSLFEFLKRGEEGHISDIGLMAESYLEAGFNYSMPLLDDRLYIGFRGKLLVGLARMQMDYDRFDVTLQNDRWAVATHGTIDITADGTKANPDTESGLFGLGDLETSPKGPSGYGLAVDLGATYDILPQLQASLAVTDLGFISWSDRKRHGRLLARDRVHGRRRSRQRHPRPGLRPRAAAIHPRGELRTDTDAARLGQRRTGVQALEAPYRHRTALHAPLPELLDGAQHHRLGQHPAHAMAHLHGQLLGARQPQRRRGAGSEHPPAVAALLHRHRPAHLAPYAAVDSHPAEHGLRHGRHRHPHRPGQPPQDGRVCTAQPQEIGPGWQTNRERSFGNHNGLRSSAPFVSPLPGRGRTHDARPRQDARVAAPQTETDGAKGPTSWPFGHSRPFSGERGPKYGNFRYLCESYGIRPLTPNIRMPGRPCDGPRKV